MITWTLFLLTFFQIIITNTNNPKEKSYFLCNNWLSKEDEDGSISRLLKGTKSLDNIAESEKMYYV